jgi:hypothetical protein
MARNIKLSATRIGTFLRCKQKYWFSYMERLPKISNPAFKLGIACHEALEFAGNIWKKKEKFTKIDVKNILDKYEEIAVREGVDSRTVHKEGYELVKKRIGNFMTGEKLIGCEFKFGFGKKNEVKTDEGIPLIGAIDKVEEINEDTLLIVDYKTSKTAPTASQMRDDVQLSIYDLVASKVWPQYERIVLSLDFLKSEMLYTYRTDEERREFSNYLKHIYEQMVGLKVEDVKSELNIFCPWCDFREYCSTYQDVCKKYKYDFFPAIKYTNDELMSEWSSVKSVKKILENRERELGQIIIEKIKDSGENLVCKEGQMYIRQSSRTAYDVGPILEVVPSNELYKVVNINKRGIEKYMDSNPAVKARVLEAAVTNYTTPFLATKKNLKKK